MPQHNPREASQQLLDWNRRHLTAHGPLDEAAIAEVFASQFTVKANGRLHPANHRNYLEFLENFRRDIRQIDYDIHETVAEGDNAVLAITAHVTRLNADVDRFEAMLMLSFDQEGLVTLWHEVYVRS
ncbi:nuclear transport factor 2 family protein [Pseudomonas asplenii]|uniref:nuclear transport factor 2 family protein n=1 Tax=Pseudomonas asplenii TaxID=53407 RepID=UPI00035D7B38|nr:nuclear transport factor 2 family protein [Pseudomonas fuscovaginae]